MKIIIASPVYAIIRIMPLGDSITQGSSSGASWDNMVSYRKALWDLLVADSYDIDFVGSQNEGSAVFGDLALADHEGHGGWRDDEIVNGRLDDPSAGKLEDWLISHVFKDKFSVLVILMNMIFSDHLLLMINDFV